MQPHNAVCKDTKVEVRRMPAAAVPACPSLMSCTQMSLCSVSAGGSGELSTLWVAAACQCGDLPSK